MISRVDDEPANLNLNGNMNVHASDMPVGDNKSQVPHLTLTYRTWQRIQKLHRTGKVEINGHGLDIATVVAVAKYVSSSWPASESPR